MEQLWLLTSMTCNNILLNIITQSANIHVTMRTNQNSLNELKIILFSVILLHSWSVLLIVAAVGLVLGRGGGILEHSYYVFMMGLGGNLGSGRQFMSWIHAQDVAGIMCHAIESPEVSGVLNAVAPAFNTNAEYTTALAKAMNRPACLPVPKFALSAIFGPVRADVMTTGSKIWPKRTLDSGYEFLYPDLQSACHEIVNQ